MRLSKLTEYGLELLLEIAVAGKKRKYVAVSQLKNEPGISNRYAESMLLSMRIAGILGSKRGIGGGFFLAKKESEITVYDVFKSLDIYRPSRRSKNIDKVFSEAEGAVLNVFKKYTLKQLLDAQKR